MLEPLATIVDLLLRWLRPAYDTAGYLIVGLGVPGDVILALGGVYAAQQRLSLPWVIVIGICAAISGESIGYWLGRRYGMGLVRRIPVLRQFEERLQKAEVYFQRRGAGF